MPVFECKFSSKEGPEKILIYFCEMSKNDASLAGAHIRCHYNLYGGYNQLCKTFLAYDDIESMPYELRPK